MKEAHVMTTPFTYPCLMQCTEEGEDLIMEFFDKFNTVTVHSTGYPEDVGIHQKWDLWHCENTNQWEPYTGREFKLSTENENIVQENVTHEWPKIMEGIFRAKSSILIVKFECEVSGMVLESNLSGYPEGYVSDSWMSCFDAEEWKPYVEATQTPSEPLPDTQATLTATELVKRLEELKHSLDDLEAVIETRKDEYSTKWAEYQDLKEQLLTII